MKKKYPQAWAHFLVLGLIFSGCIQSRGAFYFGDYSEAESLFKHGQYERAIQKYQSYIDSNPEGNLAVISEYYIARSHAALGHVKEAKEIYKEISEKYPQAIWANFSQTQLKALEENEAADSSKPEKLSS